jgi:predicted RNase H-like HicB family nuclease
MKAAGYAVLLVWSQEDEAFIARALELPGCVAHGETREEAVEQIQIAIENWIDTAKSMGRKVPQPISLEEFEQRGANAEGEQQQNLKFAIQKAVADALGTLVPAIVERLEKTLIPSRAGVLGDEGTTIVSGNDILVGHVQLPKTPRVSKARSGVKS